jgi:hypothetical protein
MVAKRPPDRDDVGRFAFRVWGYKQGEMVSLLIHLGDRLGLYGALDGAGVLTAEDLAHRTGLHPRWLHEWLRGNAAADLLASEDGERFELTEAGALVLAREQDSLQFAAGAFGPPPEPGLVDDIVSAFSTGIGLSYDRHGAEGVHRTSGCLALGRGCA